jgi:sec-independent protein translocase protein TatB
MLDFGFSEILLTSAIALVVLGPERLPKVARQVGNWMGRARLMARQLSEQLEREVNAEELLKIQEKAKSASANRMGPAAEAAPAAGPAPAVPVPPTSLQQPAAFDPLYPTPLAPDDRASSIPAGHAPTPPGGQISVAADDYPPVGHPPGAPVIHSPATPVREPPVTLEGHAPATPLSHTSSASSADASKPPNE